MSELDNLLLQLSKCSKIYHLRINNTYKVFRVGVDLFQAISTKDPRTRLWENPIGHDHLWELHKAHEFGFLNEIHSLFDQMARKNGGCGSISYYSVRDLLKEMENL